MLKKIDELQAQINEAQAARKAEEEVLAKLDAEFGGEIQRINKEFARMKVATAFQKNHNFLFYFTRSDHRQP